jgi:hypothetical protein
VPHWMFFTTYEVLILGFLFYPLRAWATIVNNSSQDSNPGGQAWSAYLNHHNGCPLKNWAWCRAHCWGEVKGDSSKNGAKDPDSKIFKLRRCNMNKILITKAVPI